MAKYRTTIVGLMCAMILIPGCAHRLDGSGNSNNTTENMAAESMEEQAGESSEISAADSSVADNSIAVSNEASTADSSVAENSTAVSTAAPEMSATDITVGSVADTGDLPSEASADAAAEKEYLDYIDAWDEWHTMEVDPTVGKSVYDTQKFVVDESDPQWITYADPYYIVMQGIDVSEHQDTIDWQAVADEGYSFAFIRVGYRGYGQAGRLCEDYMAINNLQSAKAAGLKVGAYFFSQALNEEEAREEAELAVKVIEESGVQLDLPLMYDPELIRDDDGRANDITRDQVALNTKAFKETVEDISDNRVDIYSNLPWEHELFDATTLNTYDIWYADYENPPQTPYHFVWWQYTEHGYVPGIEGEVDLDLWIIGTAGLEPST